MKLQFTTSGIMLATAFIAIWLSGMLPLFNSNRLSRDAWEIIGIVYFYGSAIWVPFAFLIYALGRRALTWRIVVGFAITEIAAVLQFLRHDRY